ncbi:MAG: PhzF family phenazine biosynthesis protein [Rhodobacteraceae bacterium]|nr:PhzF family phenazine biosynthesis protein [Paracoccaceae bacterium]
MTAYLVYDVFTDTAFGGNPLAVIPDATGLAEPLLQKIAREFNFSETTFVYPPADPAHTARVRIFTPTQEVPFAGHPTIGTAIALRDLGRPATMVLELGVGPIPCTVAGGEARFVTRRPLERFHVVAVEHAAAALSLAPGDIRTDRHAPLMASVGLPFVFAELAGPEALARAAPALDAFRAGRTRYPAPLDFAVAPYVRDESRIAMRMFAPLDNIPEDPATGSAAAALGALLASLDGAPVALDIVQGVEMGRPSRIRVEAGPDGVAVSGAARKIMEGRLTL